MFSENFERLCKLRGLKPGVVCVQAGLKQGRAANWKSTGALPKQDELAKLAMVLECKVYEFFLDNGEVPFHSQEEMLEYWQYLDNINPLSGSSNDNNLNEDEWCLLRIYGRADRRQKAQLMLQVYDFADANNIEYEESE